MRRRALTHTLGVRISSLIMKKSQKTQGFCKFPIQIRSAKVCAVLTLQFTGSISYDAGRGAPGFLFRLQTNASPGWCEDYACRGDTNHSDAMRRDPAVGQSSIAYVDYGLILSRSIDFMRLPYPNSRIILEALFLVVLAPGVLVHQAQPATPEYSIELSGSTFHALSGEPSVHKSRTESCSFCGYMSISVADGMLPVHSSQVCLKLKQSKQSSILLPADQAVRHVCRVWLGQTRVPYILAESSMQILFCTWLA